MFTCAHLILKPSLKTDSYIKGRCHFCGKFVALEGDDVIAHNKRELWWEKVGKFKYKPCSKCGKSREAQPEDSDKESEEENSDTGGLIY